MQYLRLLIAPATQPSFDIEHTTQITENHGISAAGGDVLAFAFSDMRRDLAELQRERATETAALFALVHLAQFGTLDLRQQCAGLLLDAEFAQARAGIVIGNCFY